MGLQYSPEAQKKVDATIVQEVAAVTHDRRDILKSIHESVHDLRVFDAQKISLTQARFATLLVSLSEQADKTTQQNLDMQRVVVSLTRRLFWLTIALGLIAVVQIFLSLRQGAP